MKKRGKPAVATEDAVRGRPAEVMDALRSLLLANLWCERQCDCATRSAGCMSNAVKIERLMQHTRRCTIAGHEPTRVCAKVEGRLKSLYSASLSSVDGCKIQANWPILHVHVFRKLTM